MLRLGGFVIHGNDVQTLPRCLDSLSQTCDDIVAIDSFSSDGSRELVRSMGIPSVQLAWQGYGAARAAAVKALVGVDYVFFLDSDEYMLPIEIERLRLWRRAQPCFPIYSVNRRNWACLSGRRFLYRTDRRARLIRFDAAKWTPEMIVHESLGDERHHSSGIAIEHRFASNMARRREKNEHYALLWAIRRAGARPVRPGWLAGFTHLLQDLVIKGALFRGGYDAVRLAWATARYHSDKYAYLRQVNRGIHRALVEDFRAGRFVDLFASFRSAGRGPGNACDDHEGTCFRPVG